MLFCLLIFMSFSSLAKWKVEGLDSGIADNVKLHLNSLTFPNNEFELAQFEERVRELTTTALRAYSYYKADIKIENLNRASFESDGVLIKVSPGTKVKVTKVQLKLDQESTQTAYFPEELKQVLQSFKAMQGLPLDQSKYDGLKSRLQSFASIFGYFDFVLSQHQIKINLANNEAEVHWALQFGERYKFGNLDYLTDDKGRTLVEAVMPYMHGDYFNQQLLGEFTQSVRQTAYYESVVIRANLDAMTAQQKQDNIVPIEALLKTKPRDTYQFGIGASTDSGPRITMNWKRPWVNLKGHSLSSELYFSAPKKTIALGYTIPMANPLNDFFKVQVGVQQLSEEQRDSETYTLAAQRQFGAKQENDWDKIVFLRYEYERFVQGIDEEQSTQLLLPGITLNRVRKRGDLFIDWGDRQQLTIESASDRVISDINIVRLTARTKWIRTYGKHRLIFRGDAGAIVTNNFERVPSSLRFFAGGDQSIRGFSLNSLSEKRIDDATGELELVGARFLSVASTEYAYQLYDDWRAAVFVDAGSADDDFGKSLAYGVGAGAHWLSPIGTVRLYVARGFSDEENTWRVHLTIGPGI